ncbi:MAG: 7TM diverse intracellular signaling domain-containing protein [Bacteroidales bacterium]
MNRLFHHIKSYHRFAGYFKALLVLIIFPFGSLKSQDNGRLIELDSVISPNISYNDYLKVYEDKDARLVFTNIGAVKFMDFEENIRFGKKSVIWGKLRVKSNFKWPEDVIVTIGSKRSSDLAEIFVLNSHDSLLKHALGGYFEKKDKKEIKQEPGGKFFLHLEPGNEYTVIFKIKNISGFRPAFDIKFIDKQYFSERLNRRNLVQGMLQGALWIMFLYNLFIFIYSRDRVYLYYSLYIIGIAMNFVIERGLFVEYTIPFLPKADPFFFAISTGLATAAYFQFIRAFLNTRELMPEWDKAHKWVIKLNIALTLIFIVELFIWYNIPFSVNLSNYFNLAGLFYGFVFIFFLIKEKHGLSWFFISGAIVLAVGTFISLYFLITKTPLDFDPKYFMNLATILELLIFSLGLGYRIRLNENAKQLAQNQLIEQLKQNELLKEKVNKELERRVKERTAEIEQQHEEIISQTESLKMANDALIQQKREIENKNEEISQQKRYLEKIHQDTTDSISYARRLQNVILPSESVLTKYFTGHFIYMKPKEIVSGDFYWYRYIERAGKRYFAIAVADATGHGVPGSLVGMLGISLLNETVIRNEMNTANEVLEKLRLEVKTTFSQADEHLQTRDGIDIAFAMIDLDTLEMQYSGANRPLLVFRKDKIKGTDEEISGLTELRPTKNPVGMYHKEQPFMNHTIYLEKGDMLYFFSDGYADQVGGPFGRKLYYKNFRELLSGIYQLPTSEQKEIIDSNFNNWISHKFNNSSIYRQVDDILILGVRI